MRERTSDGDDVCDRPRHAHQGLGKLQQRLATARASCLQVAADHEATVAARTEELAVVAQAHKMLQATCPGAGSQAYSLLQLCTSGDLTSSEVMASGRRLAKTHHSEALAQLASRISTRLRFRSAGASLFAKSKGLTSSMIVKLQKEADDEATEKAYCHVQLARTERARGGSRIKCAPIPRPCRRTRRQV